MHVFPSRVINLLLNLTIVFWPTMKFKFSIFHIALNQIEELSRGNENFPSSASRGDDLWEKRVS